MNRRSPTKSDAGGRYNRSVRIVAGWVGDTDFSDATGNPRVLSLQDRDPHGRASFAELAHRFGGDLPFRAVLDELTQLGVVEQLEDGSVRLKR